MSTVSGERRASRRQAQDGSTDKVVVNLETSPMVVESHRGASAPPGTYTSPIDVEALDDEVQAVSPSQVPPRRRNWRTRRESAIVVDLEFNTRQEQEARKRCPAMIPEPHSTGRKRRSVRPVIHCLSPEREEGSNVQSNDMVQVRGEPAKVALKELTFTCPVCLNKLEQPSTTICGHIFCEKCIKASIQAQKKCPTCRRKLRMNNYHRVYLPSTADCGGFL